MKKADGKLYVAQKDMWSNDTENTNNELWKLNLQTIIWSYWKQWHVVPVIPISLINI